VEILMSVRAAAATTVAHEGAGRKVAARDRVGARAIALAMARVGGVLKVGIVRAATAKMARDVATNGALASAGRTVRHT